MNNGFLNTENWAEHKYSDVFIIERGYYNKRPEEYGKMKFISASINNNGVTDKINPNIVEKVYKGNCITVVNNGYAGEAFYQKDDFACSHDVNILRLKQGTLTENIAMFLLPIIRKERFKFNYGRKWRYDRMKKTKIKLPINKKGNPDLELMSKYIDSLFNKEELYKKLIPENKFIKNKLNFKNIKWGLFAYKDIFEVKKGKRVIMTDLTAGKYPFVSAIDHHNGVSFKSNIVPNHPANTITVNYDGNGVAEAYYQSEPFWALDSTNVLYPKFKLTPHIAMFLITLIKKEKYRFSYGRKWHKERMENSIIRLPVSKNGQPDWDFIENYIKEIAYAKELN